ncbi:sigma 54-interacting transcriptional regulator [Loigolactobacillus coryniformis]|uniref:sigma 54-interacting transcriptional regulator n=1 Tax=Loigolactobacillus coryniformis TaxID=1610 RepID=UPI001C5F8B14|nr:sigma 54-interacting transcriptional regulator [Loigolactobacillus coryniformis]MBW4803751.1 sigma 54-interacting transcriptional regulator [Loigolactobacillus coryniformis subsp. torquens]MBW4806442.1 sigma 54-interacting transcriptional regulator [Loigolactobacillus coryniformis subsp. torquens]
MKKQDIYQYLLKETVNVDTHKLSSNHFSKCTTQALMDHFDAKNNIINHHLNTLYREHEIIKINTKPAFYIPIAFFKNTFRRNISQSTFQNWTELQQACHNDPLNDMIGSHSSLQNAIHQAKIALQYPHNGLPLLVTGKTGTGKTFLVKKLFEYGQQKNIFATTANLTTFNCAEYADNPELLSSKLFGHKKGAFTGAVSDQKGLIELSDNGMLFIDEVHRLNPENQEKLFYLMDEGRFKPIGENEHYKTVNTHLAFATTEDTNGLLDTFKRRIPISIKIPSLESRSYREKKAFIYYFFKKESTKINQTFQVTNSLFLYLSNHHFDGNVGQMENTIKYICANALLDKTDNQSAVKIKSDFLPQTLSSDYRQQANTQLNGSITISAQTFLHDPEIIALSSSLKKKSDLIFNIFKKYASQELNQQNFINTCYQEITSFLNQYFQGQDQKIFDLSYLTPNFEETRDTLSQQYQIELSNDQFSKFKQVTALFSVLNTDNSNLYFENNIESQLNATFKIPLQQTHILVELLREKLRDQHFEQYPDKRTSLAFFFYFVLLAHELIDHDHGQMQGVIICHGYSTASSISDTSNTIIGQKVFQGINMPLETSFQSIIQRLKNYFALHETKYGIIILIDIGHSQELKQALEHEVNGPIGIIDSVSTKLALDIGIKMANKETVTSICKGIDKTYLPTASYFEPYQAKEKAIIISCETGIGTAKTLQKIFLEKLPKKVALRLLTSDFDHLKTMQLNSTIFSRYDIVGIIGTSNPRLPNIAYIGLDDILSEHGLEHLQRFFGPFLSTPEIDTLNDDLMSTLSLENLVNILSILNPEKTIILISHMIQKWEQTFHLEFPNTLKTTLYIHISCMLERVFVNDRDNHLGLNYDSNFYKNHKVFSEAIHSGLAEFEQSYHLVVNHQEYEYLYQIVSNHISNFSY